MVVVENLTSVLIITHYKEKIMHLKFNLVLLSLLIINVSCSKETYVDPTLSSTNAKQSQDSLALRTARQMGVAGDGITDDTDKLQLLINTSTDIVLDGGTYVINKTLNLPSGKKITGRNGAVIITGNNMSGTLLIYGRYFNIDGVRDCSISNITFKPGPQAIRLAGWIDACIYVNNSINSTITGNTFDFKVAYNLSQLEAIWVSGPKSTNTIISKNVIKTLGIKYAENGASYTTVQGNVISNAHSNALTANGNSATVIKGCKLIDNVITDAGRMGIEDWGLVEGTLIQGNTIKGTGLDPKQSADGFGISAVGYNSKVLTNNISGAKWYCLEIGGNHNIIADSNIITDASKLAIGIILNYTGPLPGGLTNSYSQVINNSIIGCARSLNIFGTNTPNCLVQNNIFKDPKTSAISVESDALLYNIKIASNKFLIESPTAVFRSVIFTYTNVASGSGKQNLVVFNNKVDYSVASGNGKGFDLSFLILTDNAKITFNEITGNNIKSGGYPVYGMSSNGGKATGLVITNNKVTGALVDLKGYSKITMANNVFSSLRN